MPIAITRPCGLIRSIVAFAGNSPVASVIGMTDDRHAVIQTVNQYTLLVHEADADGITGLVIFGPGGVITPRFVTGRLTIDVGIAQLINAGSDRHLWSDTYERELDDIFGIQEEISDNIVAALKVALNVEEASAIERLQRPTDNPEAHDAAFNRRWLDALMEFEAAIESGPKNAGVRQWYAEALAEAGYLQTALAEIDKACQLDPAAPIINNVYSMLASIQGDDALAIRHRNKALKMGLTAAWGHPLHALIRSGEWDIIERLAYPVLAAESFGRLCIEAHRDPSLYENVRTMVAEEMPQGRFIGETYVYCAALVGDNDRAFAILDMVLEGEPTATNTLWGPDEPYVVMRQSARFRQVLEDVGLLDLYKVRGWPDRCRAEGEQDFDCD